MTRSSSCDPAVERAAALLVHSMRESDVPISELSDALARMARTLSLSSTPLIDGDRIRPAADAALPKLTSELDAFRDALARDIAVCIESLQFHDRLMQQLAQVRDVLSGVAGNRLPAGVPDVRANEGGIEGSIELF